MKCKRSSDARKLDQTGMHTLRMQALKAIENGQPVAKVAKTFGVAERTLYRWLSRFASDGQQGLKNQPKTGRPPKLNGEEMVWLARTVREETPQQLKFPYALWTLSLIGELIRQRLNKSLSPVSVLRVMRLLGFTAQKPLYRAWQRDPVLVQKWQDEQYPEIRKEARKRGARIYFADEPGLRSDYHLGTTWAPEGRTPVVEKTGRRFSVNMISAVSPSGECRFMVHQGTINADVFIVFLKRLLAGADRPIFLIVDGHPAHRARKVRQFVDATDDQLRLYFLPPYAPNLNPDEQVWAHVKREIGRRAVQNKAHVGADAASGLVHSLVATAANAADVTQAHHLLHGAEAHAFGDSAYQGVDKRAEHAGRSTRWYIAMKRSARAALGDDETGEALQVCEVIKAKIRARVEHPFHVLKNLFGHRKARYRGLAKNEAQLHTLFGLANLLLARRRLALAPGGGVS